MVKIKNYKSRIDAEIDKGILETNGITASITADDAGGFRPDLMMATGGVWVLVDKSDAEKALNFLQ